MRFNPKARLDRSQVQVRRGGGGGAGGSRGRRLPIPAGNVGRGGVGGVILLIVVFVVVQALSDGGTGDDGTAARSDDGPVSTSELTECRTGEDAAGNPDCARLAVVNSIQAYWERTLPQQTGTPYAEADTVIFTDQVDTGCGPADSEVGPFYCPVGDDRQVYLDTSFFEDMLQGELGAQGGDFAEAYVLAHEYGHHVENLLGYMGRVRTQQGPQSDSVRLELMADCLAGMWAQHATTSPGPDGEVLIIELDDQDIAEALDAAAAVGDDRIQEQAQGTTSPETWTHGSAEARQYWFDQGFTRGGVSDCDTFETGQLYPDDAEG